MSKVKIIGHRGAANHTENTIPSFESAIEQKVDGIELDVRAVARSSVTAASAIAAGTTITREMLTIKRPGGGIAPGEIDSVVGRVAAADIAADTTITSDMIG